jgi:transcription initiation factor TFIIIB Brf1 subunit/transcription initiation factor TFIIB
MISTVLTNLETNGIEFSNEFRAKCYALAEYIAKSLDAIDKPYKNSTNATVVWLVGLMENEKIRQQDITDVSEVTVQTIRTTLRKIIYPTFKVDKATLAQLTVDEFVNGIRKEK